MLSNPMVNIIALPLLNNLGLKDFFTHRESYYYYCQICSLLEEARSSADLKLNPKFIETQIIMTLISTSQIWL